MSWQIQPAGDAFPQFAETWDHLNREMHGGHPLFDSRFVGGLLAHFSNGQELLCIHRSGENVDGALILSPRRLGRWALFLPAQAQVGPLLVKDARCLDTLMPTLPGHAWTIDLLAVDPEFEPDWTGLRLPRTMIRHDLTMAVDTTGDFTAFWQARPNKLRTNLRRYQRKSGEHTTATRVTVEPTEISAAVNRYAVVESAGWKAESGTAIGTDNPQGQFYEQVLRDFAATGQARIIELWLDDKLAASRLVICHDRMWIMLKTTYDESLAAMAPGRQLLYEALQFAFTDIPDGKVEFYTNATRDQAEWATHLRHICHHQVYRNTSVANLDGIVRALRHRLADDRTEPSHSFEPTNLASYHHPREIPEAIRTMFDSAASREVELSQEWFANIQTGVFDTDATVRYYSSDQNGTPIALLPIHVCEGNGRGRPEIESLSNFYTSIYSPLLAPTANSAHLGQLLQAASSDFPRSNAMNFHPMAADSREYEAMIVALRSIGWIPFRYFCFGNWYLKVDRPWRAYLEQRDGALRNTIKRKGRRFLATGGTFDIITDTNDIESAIADFNALYRQRWKKTEPYAAFIPGLIRCLAESGKLRLGIARIAGIAIAAQIWIVNNNKASIYKMAYDEAYAFLAPGTLLTSRLMEHVIDLDGVKEVDYLIGDDPYKQSWMNHRRERWGIIAFNAGSVAGLSLMTIEICRRAIKALGTIVGIQPTNWSDRNRRTQLSGNAASPHQP